MVDLHQHLFAYGMFRIKTEDLFARARLDERAFGAPTHLIDPYDGYAPLLGHFVKGRVRARSGWRLRDFSEVAAHFDLQPTRCAKRLIVYGLRRAALFMLPLLVEHRQDDFAESVLASLTVGRRDRALLGLSDVCRKNDHHKLLEVVWPHLLDGSFASGLRSTAWHLAEAVTREESYSTAQTP